MSTQLPPLLASPSPTASLSADASANVAWAPVGWTVLPALVEPHAHLDKALTADSVVNERGDLRGAIDAWLAFRESQPVDAIAARARTAALRYAANGTTLIRTHADVADGLGLRAVEAVLRVREELAPVVAIQVVAAVSLPAAGSAGRANRTLLEAALDAGANLVGGAPWLGEDPGAELDALLNVAARRGVGLDLHLDETTDPRARTVDALLDRLPGFAHPVTASHIVRLASRPEVERRAVAERLAAAGVSVVTNPITSLFLQGREQDPPTRGITAIRDLLAAGVQLAAGGDNLRDPFNPVGRADPLEAASLLVTAGHLRVDEALAAVTTTARRVVAGVSAAPAAEAPIDGALAPADALAVDAASAGEAIAFAPAGRVVRRAGRIVARTAASTWVGGLGSAEMGVAS